MVATMLTRRVTKPMKSLSCKVCLREAHLSATALLNSTNLPPPPPSSTDSISSNSNSHLVETSPSTSTAPSSNPLWSDPSYVARYRNPNKFSSLNRRPIASTSKIESPRTRRLDMEALWSGGDYSPAIPLEKGVRPTAKSKVSKHALLFPGSGSQYVGMGHFLSNYPAAQKVWDEAEDTLQGFESWMNSLGLKDMEGDLAGLGRIMDERKSIRMSQTSLKKVVFEGPQVSLHSLLLIPILQIPFARN